MYNKPTSSFRDEQSDDMHNKDLCIHGVGSGMFFKIAGMSTIKSKRRAARASKACPARHTLSSPLQNFGATITSFHLLNF